MNTTWKQGLAAAALGLAAVAAQAGNVQWSIGINLPPVATVISGGPDYPYYAPAPVYSTYPAYPVAPYYGPPAAVYRPTPIYYSPPVHYRPAPIYRPAPRPFYGHSPRYLPPPAVVDRRWAPPHGHWGRHDGWRGDSRWDQRPEPRGGWNGPRDGRGDDHRGPGQRDERRYRPGPG